MDLICPAGNLISLKAAVDAGANAVYTGFRDATNARHFPGLNFTPDSLNEGLAYARKADCKVFVAVNTYPQADNWDAWRCAVDLAATLRVDALIAADIGVLDYASETHPEMRLHLSVQGSATNPDAVAFYQENFRIQRVILPRVLSLTQIAHVIKNVDVEVEVFGFGSLCVMVEGRCLLSSYFTGLSPNTFGACSPASHVRWLETPNGLEARLNGCLIDRFASGEDAGYPTVCKGRFRVGNHEYNTFEEPTSLNTLDILPALQGMGVAAIKLEGRQRSPAYVAKVTQVMRAAIDACQAHPNSYRAEPQWQAELGGVAEGRQTTLGAYNRPWM